MLKVNCRSGLWLLLVLLLLNACTGLGPAVADKELLLKQRCEGFKEARIKNDRAVLSKYYMEPDNFKAGNIVYLESKITAIEIADDGLTGNVKIESKVMAMGFVFNKLKELWHWQWHKNEWYRVKSSSSSNPFTTLLKNKK